MLWGEQREAWGRVAEDRLQIQAARRPWRFSLHPKPMLFQNGEAALNQRRRGMFGLSE
jgi:hypothetical protein